jgi:hypothetical protein
VVICGAVADELWTGAVRCITSGFGSRLKPRPIKIPSNKIPRTVVAGCSQRVLRKRTEQRSQNLRLVHKRQRKRTILSPQSQQKFGR